MANFNYRKFLKENKSTFHSSLTEGQFSWFTQDTDQQIGSQEGNTLPFVYMHDNEGNKWLEKNYDGYGEFGGKDYYELLDQMNGGTGDRNEGVRKAFDPTLEGKLLFPALTVSSTLPSNHDFTQEAEHDPNQSWLPYEEDNDEEEEYGYDDDEELDENITEAVMDVATVAQAVADAFTADDPLDIKYVITPGSVEGDLNGGGFDLDAVAGPNTPGEDWEDENGFGIDYYLGKYAGGSFVIKNEGDVSVVKNAAMRNAVIAYVTPEGEIDMVYNVENHYNTMSDKLTGMKENTDPDEPEEQGSGPVNPNPNEPDQPETELDQPETELSEISGSREKIALKIANYFEIPVEKLDGFELDGTDDIKELTKFVASISKPFPGKPLTLDQIQNTIEGFIKQATSTEPSSDIVYPDDYGLPIFRDRNNENKTKMKKSELKELIKSSIMNEMTLDIDNMEDAPESEVDFLAEVDAILAEADEVAVDDTEVAVDGEENINVDTTTEVDPNVKAVQDALTQAQAAAQKLGDQKLTDQIGNTITFFTRAHVVEKGAVAEADEMEEGKKSYYKDAEEDDAEHIKALEKDMKYDKQSSLKETLLLQKRAGIITEAQYKEKMQSLKEIMKPTDDELTTIAKYYMSKNSYGKYNKAIADIKSHISMLNYDLPKEREAIEAYKLVSNKVKELSNAAPDKGKLSNSERVEKLDPTLENKYKEFIEHLHIART